MYNYSFLNPNVNPYSTYANSGRSYGTSTTFAPQSFTPAINYGSPDSTQFSAAAFDPYEAMGGYAPKPVNFAQNTAPNGIPGGFSSGNTNTNNYNYPGGFSFGPNQSIGAAQGLLGSVGGDLNWMNQFTNGLANSGINFGGGGAAGGANGGGGQTRSSGGNAPLTVTATALQNGNKQVAVSYIDIQEVGNPNNANGQYYSSGWYSQSDTLNSAKAQKKYYVTVKWANGQSYRSTVTDSNGGRSITISQPN